MYAQQHYGGQQSGGYGMQGPAREQHYGGYNAGAGNHAYAGYAGNRQVCIASYAVRCVDSSHRKAVIYQCLETYCMWQHGCLVVSHGGIMKDELPLV